MPLQKQTISINFGNGIDTKTDPKLVQPGKLVDLQNRVFKKNGRLDKRNGYQILSGTTTDGSTLSGGSALAVFKDELLQYNKQNLYSYSSGAMRWLNKGPVISSILHTKQIINNTAQQSQCDSAINSGVAVYAWEDSRGGVRASVYDYNTGTTMLSDVSLNASASRARCLSFGSYLYVFYYVAGSLLARRISPVTPTSFDAPVTISTTVNTANPNYDINTYATNRVFFAHNVQGASQIKTGWLDEDLVIGTGALAPQFIAEAATNCLSIINGPSFEFYVVYHNGTSGLRAAITNTGGTVIVGPVTVDPTTSPIVTNVTGYTKRDNTGVNLYFEFTQSPTYNTIIKTAFVSSSGAVSGLAVFLRSVGLWSRAFRYDDPADTVDRGYIGITYESDFQSTYFVVRNDKVVAAKIQPNLGSGLTTRPMLQTVTELESGKFTFAILNKVRIISENADLFSQLGVAQTEIDFDASESFNHAELGDNLHIVGGVLNMYDGVSVVEHGFHLYPEGLSASQSGSSGVSDGTYQYIALYEWKDNHGNIHRSATSVPITFVVTGGPRNVSVVVPTLRLTQKQGTRVPPAIVLFRTEDLGSIFYRVSSIVTPTYNDTSIDSVTIVDTTDDATLISQEILYTTGGILDNQAPPASSFITVYKNRLFLAGLEDDLLLWYSKINAPDAPVEFAAELTLQSDPGGGAVSSLTVLDDKILIFKNDRLFYSYGDGPNNTGQNGEFAPVTFVTDDTGCIAQNSIIRAPQGIFYKSAKGIYALDSTLNPQYIGAEVEDFNQYEITSATLKSDVNQIRFTTLNGPCLVYDYYFKQWSTFTNHYATDSLIWNNTFILLKTDGNVYNEVVGYYKDNGAGFGSIIETGWIALDSVTGFQRVYDLAFLGEYKSPHILRIKVAYDFSAAFRSTIIFNPDTALGISHYGDDAVYGGSAVYGGYNNSYRFKASLSQQKCQSIRFLIEEITTSATEGSQEAFTITSIGLQVGIKGHLGRMPAAQSIGTQGVS